MRHSARTVLALAAASTLLGGCHSIFHSSRMDRINAKVRVSGTELAAPARELQEGKRLLAEGSYALAISAFHSARLDPGLAGEANNGLGVAYAQMGRADLAARYFTLAVFGDPADTRFRANLARLKDEQVRTERTRMLAAASAPAPAHSAPGPSAGARLIAASSGVIRIELPEARLVRSAPNMVTLSLPARAAPAKARRMAGPAYPVIISLAKPTPRVAPEAAKAEPAS